MANSDIKYGLRKLDFPQCAREALCRIEPILAGRCPPSFKQLDMSMDVIAEFVFLESDRRGSRRNGIGLNPLQELQLIEVICDFFSGDLNDTSKNIIFLSIFGGTESEKRMPILCKLGSMAISALRRPVLLAIGTWLQQTGCSSPLSLQLADSLIRDHFKLQLSNEQSLKNLADIAPQFVANFMAATTEIYLRQKDFGFLSPPPKNLLNIITTWVCANPKLCMSAQINPAALPSGGIPMAAITPLAGLIQWCALAPLRFQSTEDGFNQLINRTSNDSTAFDITPTKKIKLENEKDYLKMDTSPHCDKKDKSSCGLSVPELYKQLHLGVLNSLLEGRRSHGPPTAVNAQHLAAITKPVQLFATQLIQKGDKLGTHVGLQECLDRIGQATQVALANGCVYGNIANLLTCLEALPENRLLTIVVKTHQQVL